LRILCVSVVDARQQHRDTEMLRSPVLQSFDPLLLRAVCRTEDHTRLAFDTMTYYSTATVIARWRERMDSAFETVECMFAAGNRHFKCLVVLIAANFTSSHVDLPNFDLHAFFRGKMSRGRKSWLGVCFRKPSIHKQKQVSAAWQTNCAKFYRG